MPVQTMHHDHTMHAIRARLEEGSEASYLRDWIYGGIDGAVTTFAIVFGVIGANLGTGIILVLGAANIVADGFSMAASNYTGTKAENDEFERIRAHEEHQIVHDPAGETLEIREIYRAKGFDGADLDRAVEIITADKTLWVNTMLTEEYGLPMHERSARKAATGTFIAFLLCGMVPLAPYFFSPWLVGRGEATLWATALTALTFFAIGSVKARWSLMSWWRSGFETLAIGMAAAGLAYVIGYWLRSFV
ncbi:MAG: VIT1/CCC1 transporter family protein [Alphaproteobacteria bacterium]